VKGGRVNLFSPLRIGGMEISGRIVRSATNERGCDEEGRPLAVMEEIFTDLAGGECPLVISGYAYVHGSGRSAPGQNGITTEEHVRGWRAITESCRAANAEVRLAMQIVHGGRQIDPSLVPEPLAPSAVPAPGLPTPREMTVAEVERTIEDFAAGAARAKAAGFDAVQLHLAHGYLLSEFLSGHTNRRTDAYGGTAAKRRRAPLAVVRKVRETVGEGYPILVKMNCRDFVPGGVEPDEAAEHARALAEAGVDGIEISGWMMEGDAEQSPSRPGNPMGEGEAYYLADARAIREAVKGAAVGLCGGIRTREKMEALLEREGFDFIAMSRPFIAEPDLVRNLRAGEKRVKCISCNQCGQPIHCPPAREGKLGE